MGQNKVKKLSKLEYLTILASNSAKKGDYGKACESMIQALHNVETIKERDNLLYKLAFYLGKEGNYIFKEQALLKILNYGELKIKAALLLFINAYKQENFVKIDHYFRIMQECILEAIFTQKLPDPIDLSDEGIDIEIFNNIQFDEKNIFPIEYYIDDSMLTGSKFLGTTNIVVSTADGRAKSKLMEAVELFDRDNANDAIEILDEAMSSKKLSENMKAQLYNAKAYMLYQINKIKESFDCLQEASYYDKDDIKTLSLYLQFALYSKNDALVEETIENLVNAKIKAISDIKLVANDLCLLKQYDKAINYVETALKEQPFNYELNKLLAVVYINSGDKDSGLKIFERLRKKYGVEVDCKYYLMVVVENYEKPIQFDCTESEEIATGLLTKTMNWIRNFPNLTAANHNLSNKLEYSFDYLLRLPNHYSQVAKYLVQYIRKFDVDYAFLDFLLEHAYLYNSKYLIPLTYIHCLNHINTMFYCTANGLFTKNPIMDIRHNPESNKEYTEEVGKGYHLAFSVAVNSKLMDKRQVSQKLTRTILVLDKVNREALVEIVKDEKAFAELLFKITFDADIIDEYDVFTYDEKVFKQYCEIFDIINYKKYLADMEESINGNSR